MPGGFEEIWHGIEAGSRVWIAGGVGEPTAALDQLAQDPALGRDLVFAGVWVPGVNRRDPSANVPGAAVETLFVHAGLRDGFAAGRVRFCPRHYSAVPRWIAMQPPEVAILQVSPPQNGQVTPGLACDVAAHLAATPARLIGEVNPAMPAPPHAPRIPVERFEALIEAETPLLVHDAPQADDVTAAIAGRIAGLINPGDTVNVGIGRAANAVLHALHGHRDLGYHAGMITDALPPLVETGVVTRGATAGIALGTQGLYDWAATSTAVQFAPIGATHDAARLAAIPRLVTVGSAIEIDLSGQANLETLGGRQISGHGGAADFQRGALASPGGRAITALPSTAGRSRVSRVKIALEAGTPVSLPRADAGLVVTEHGVADLRDADLDSRADALIAIADPAHRDALADGWAARRGAM
ncbi:MAG: acetyl-CoA hydrolase/transferase C-terminal domain-containing protein [Pseudomonadota bacterium]